MTAIEWAVLLIFGVPIVLLSGAGVYLAIRMQAEENAANAAMEPIADHYGLSRWELNRATAQAMRYDRIRAKRRLAR